MTQQLCVGEVDSIDDDEVVHCELTIEGGGLTYIELDPADAKAVGLQAVGDTFECVRVRDGIVDIRKKLPSS